METTTLTTNEAVAVGGILATFGIVTVIWSILLIIGWWKMFTKAGEKGWKSIIPIYNLYIAFKIAGMFPWWPVIIFVLSVVVPMFFPDLMNAMNTENATVEMTGANVTGVILMSIIGIISAVLEVVWAFKIAKAFKRGLGTAILVVFFPNIMTLVLGFGSAKYDKAAKYGK